MDSLCIKYLNRFPEELGGISGRRLVTLAAHHIIEIQSWPKI